MLKLQLNKIRRALPNRYLYLAKLSLICCAGHIIVLMIMFHGHIQQPLQLTIKYDHDLSSVFVASDKQLIPGSLQQVQTRLATHKSSSASPNMAPVSIQKQTPAVTTKKEAACSSGTSINTKTVSKQTPKKTTSTKKTISKAPPQPETPVIPFAPKNNDAKKDPVKAAPATVAKPTPIAAQTAQKEQKKSLNQQSIAEKPVADLPYEASAKYDNEPIVVGRQEWDILCSYQAMYEEMKRVWHAPAGVNPECACTLLVTVDSTGTACAVIVQESSGILAYDIAARNALFQARFTAALRGRQLLITFKP